MREYMHNVHGKCTHSNSQGARALRYANAQCGRARMNFVFLDGKTKGVSLKSEFCIYTIHMLVSCKRHISIVGERDDRAREGRPPGVGGARGGEISYCERELSKRDANKSERERSSFSRVSVFILPEYVQSNTQIELKHTFQLVLLSSTSLQPVMKCFCQSERLFLILAALYILYKTYEWKI